MKYYLSTIADVTEEAGDDDWGKLVYTEKTAEIVKANGLGIEIAEFCISENMDKRFDDVLPHVLKNAEASPDKTLHAPYNELFPMAIEPLLVDIAYKRYEQSLDYCHRFGATKLIVHANYIQEMYWAEWFVSRHIAFWKKFLAEHDDDIVICVENVQEEDPELILRILREVDDPRLRMCLDVGHANLTPVAPIDWLKACAPFVSHYHIHNNFGPPAEGRKSWGDRHLSPGNGNIDMKTLLTVAEELTPNATAAIESYELDESVAWLKENGFIGDRSSV